METGWPVKSLTQRAYDALEPVAGSDAANAWHLLAYVDALCGMFQPIADLAEDTPEGVPGWAAILDIDRIPNEGLPWLGQMLGVQIDPSLPDDGQRQQIRDRENWQRGTPRAMIDAARQYLSGDKIVDFRERDTGPYHLSVVTYSGETSITPFGYEEMMALLINVIDNNPVPNPDFESGVTGYVLVRATLIQSDDMYAGSKAGRLIKTTDATVTMYAAVEGDTGALRLGMQPTVTYTFSARVRVPSGQGIALNDVRLRLTDRIGAGAYNSTTSAAPTAFDEYQELKVTRQIAAGATEAIARLWVDNAGAVAGPFVLFDNVRLDAGTAVRTAGTYQTVWQNYATYQELYDSGSGVSNLVRAALEREKPAGIIMDYRVNDAQDYWTLWFDHVDYEQVNFEYLTYQEIYDDAPVPAPAPIYSTFWTDDYLDLYNLYESYQIVYDYFSSY